MAFKGVNQNLQFLATREGLVISVDWLGERVDLLACIDATPEKQTDGSWQCALCDMDARKSYASLEAFWVGELIEYWLPLVPRQLLL